MRPDSDAMRGWYDRYVEHHVPRLALDLDLANRFVDRGSPVLEIGSVPPVLTAGLHAEGHSVVGLDLDPSRFARGIDSAGLRVLRCDIEQEAMPISSDSQACVLLNEVFEHLRLNPPAVLAECLRVLRPGGVLMLSTPNMRGYRGIRSLVRKGRSAFLQGNIYEQYAKLETLGHMGHVREYTPRDLRELLGRVGFDVERILFRGEPELLGERLVSMVLPAALPFFTVLARKPGE